MHSTKLAHEFLSVNAKKFPGKEALVCGKERLTYGEIDLLSNSLSGYLASKGVKKGDRVLIFMDNSAEAVISIYGILKAGAAFVVLNPLIKAQKLNYILRDCTPEAAIFGSAKAGIVKDAISGLESTPGLLVTGAPGTEDFDLNVKADTWEDAVTVDKGGREMGKAPLCENDLAALIYTSGSTGEPKGVMSSHMNMVSAAGSITRYLENVPEDIVINVLPLSFDYGLYQVIMAFMYGGTVVLEKGFSYPVKILERIEEEKVTGFPIVPTIAAMLLKLKNLENFDLSSLRYMTNTGAALPVEHIRKIEKILPHVKFYSMYGLTECKRVSYLPPEDLAIKPDSVGIPMPGCSARVVDDEGKELPPGEVGELVVYGENVMQGYWNSPELTKEVFKEGFIGGGRALLTGDLFRMDRDGYLYFVGRKDDQIKSRGERISPKEIENVICGIEGVSEAAVVGVPDEILGRAVKAFVVRNGDARVGEGDVLKQCKEHLEIFMVPKYVHFLRDLPKTPNGKVDKKLLLEWEGV